MIIYKGHKLPFIPKEMFHAKYYTCIECGVMVYKSVNNNFYISEFNYNNPVYKNLHLENYTCGDLLALNIL